MSLRFNPFIYGALFMSLIIAIQGQPRSGGQTPYVAQSTGGFGKGVSSSPQSGSSQDIGIAPAVDSTQGSVGSFSQGVGGSNKVIDRLGQFNSGSRVETGSSGAGQGVGSGQAGNGLRVAAGRSGPAPYAGSRYGSPQVSRVDALFNPTVTQFVTIDRFVTLTDQAFQSVAVTLTSLTVQTVTAETRGVVQTPVDDRVALQTTVVVRPSTLTLTHVQSDFRIVTERALDYVTITHTSYVIMQTTYTTTATQVLSYTSTLVRTNINTKSTTFTDYRTITDTVLVRGGYYGNRQF